MEALHFVQQQFMPHGMCYFWNPRMLVLQVASDAGIALAYFSIPILLLYFVGKRRDVPFGGTFAMFCLFIVACGMTHVMGIWTIWHPAYWLDGYIKAVTAVVSLATAAMLIPVLPKALAMESPAELERRNARLEQDLHVRHAALDESERQYRSLAEALPQIVWTADADGAVDSYNTRWFEYTGMTLEQTRGWGWEPVIHPDDLAACVRTWRLAVANGTPYEFEHRFKRASDGVYRWHLGRALPIKDTAGNVMKWFGTATDIDDLKSASEAAGRFAEQLRLTETLQRDLRAREAAEAALRASEERFAQVEEHAPIGLALVAANGRFIRVNPALCKLLGYSKNELLASTFVVFTHPDDLEEDLNYLKQTLDGTIVNYEMEKRYFHKDGHIVWASLSVSFVREDASSPAYFIAQIQDISARKSAEHVVKSAQLAALAATEAKSRFLATMSHEIRTPMNGIIGMTELLSLSQLSDEQHEYVKVVRDSGRSLLRVLNDILDYSKIEAGKLDLETTDFDLMSQLKSVVALLGPQFDAKTVLLTTHVDADVPLMVKGDPGRVRQILINLVGNALKFTPSGGDVKVLVTTQPSEEPGTIPIRFSIVDTGVGIAPDVRDRLFEPFSQVDSSTTRKYGGTGLGLSICKQLVDLMGGRIGVETAPGAGSTFYFMLSLRPSDCGERALDAPLREMGDRRAKIRTRHEKLLLAEDNEVNVLLAIRQFKQLGFNVTVVANGREAVAAVQSEAFDIVFMDCHMPEMDGLDATREIRKLSSETAKRVPIVAMTANAQAEDRQACLAAGMDDYMSKPATLSTLSCVLARWLPGGNDG